MANPFQQQVLLRKVIYLLLIVALFTLSLVHRRLFVEPQAFYLQMRETARGEVELTSSAARLALTGSSGLASTVLWWIADKKQQREEWNELELVVRSITKLQPHFSTPWLYQSWNLAYNVARECDRPRDKYHYISRGLELLAEGERRNQGAGPDTDARLPRFPGNPDMRFNMGVFYQMKIGNSDEKVTMRCLFEMSCIDPIQREQANVQRQFGQFCHDHPRLIRRLREELRYETPDKVFKFLEDNKDVPTRFEKPAGNIEQERSKLKPPRQQFPVLPPQLKQTWPNPDDRDLTHESIDVFLVARTWFQYAQEPLPDPATDFVDSNLTYDPLKKRIPRHMTLHLFRGYPSLAEEYRAENLEDEGFFDEGGWPIKDWFEKGLAGEQEFRVATEPKYHAQPAWQSAYDMYKKYGIDNGMDLEPADLDDYTQKAKLYRAKYGDRRPAHFEFLRDPDMAKSFRAAQRLYWYQKYRNLTNYPERLAMVEAEKSRTLIAAKKALFYAERLRREADPEHDPEKALALFEEGFPLWLDAALSYPLYAKIGNVQEDIYEAQLKYLSLQQKQRASYFRRVLSGMAQLNVWPYQFAKFPKSASTTTVDATRKTLEEMLEPSDKVRIISVRKVRGPLDRTVFFAGEHAAQLKDFLIAWSAGAGYPPFLVYPGQQNLTLTRTVFKGQYVASPWRPLLDEPSIQGVRSRLGLDRPRK